MTVKVDEQEPNHFPNVDLLDAKASGADTEVVLVTRVQGAPIRVKVRLDEAKTQVLVERLLESLGSRGDKGEIRYQGGSPFRVTPARESIARASSDGVEMTIYASVAGKGPTDVQIQVAISANEARELAYQLLAGARDVDPGRGR